MCTLTLRPITDTDTPFLTQLFAELREAEFAFLPLPHKQKQHLIQSQYQLQFQQYLANYPEQDYQLVLMDEQPVGRLLLSRMPFELRLVDISLLSNVRGRGIGSALLAQVFQLAHQYALPVTLHVDITNTAQQFYSKLGFDVVRQQGMQYLMSATPPA